MAAVIWARSAVDELARCFHVSSPNLVPDYHNLTTPTVRWRATLEAGTSRRWLLLVTARITINS